METDFAKPAALLLDCGEYVLLLVWSSVVLVGYCVSSCVGIGSGMETVQVIYEKLIEQLLPCWRARGHMFEVKEDATRRKQIRVVLVSIYENPMFISG